MKCSICILHHPKRRQFIPYLLYKLGDIKIFTDSGQGYFNNCIEAWNSYDRDALWHLIIEDDALICKDFYNELDKILRDENIVYNLFYENDKVFGGVAVCIPTKYIDGLLDYSQNGYNRKVFYYPFDSLIKKYCELNNIKTSFVVPSLVDHRQVDSLLKNKLGRKAKSFIGE
jgi:hypothetical protein